MKTRIDWIDTTKAIGIFVVLINHAMLNLGIISYLGGMVYMPIFFVLSGYTFKENEKEYLQIFVRNKAKRLLVPYFGFQILLTGIYTAKNIVGGQTFLSSIMPLLGALYSRNALFPKQEDVLIAVSEENVNLMSSLNAPLWFLTALFLSLVIYKIILLKAEKNSKKEYGYVAISMLIGIALKYYCPILLPWSLDTAFISVGFLHLGRLLARRNCFVRLYEKPAVIGGLVLLFVISSFLNGSGNMSIRAFGRSVLLYFVAGGSGTICVMLFAKGIEKKLSYVTKLLACIGRHTIGILALHLAVFTAVAYLPIMNGLTGTLLEKVAQILLSVVLLVPIDQGIQKYLPFLYGRTRRAK